MNEITVHKNSKIFLAGMFILVMIAALATYYKYVVLQDFEVIETEVEQEAEEFIQ